MKITLISPYPDITAFGLRTISAYLKSNGFQTHLIFLPDPSGDDLKTGAKRYDDRALTELIPLCKDSALVGITLMTNFYDGAVQITEKIKSGVDAPVIWGGIHATVRPEESLEHADMVCVGEGEEAILELASRIDRDESFFDVQNIWIKKKGMILRNPIRRLSENLDKYPNPDYSTEDSHILDDGHLKILTHHLMKKYLGKGTVSTYLKMIGYQTMTGRGCPHSCSYCVNDTLKKMYGKQNYLRWRSTEHVLDELIWVKENLPYIGFIWISDDAFLARPTKNLEQFCRAYKEKIDLPFMCLASPMVVTEEKMELLVTAGLIYLQMGVETGSSKVQELFNRKQMNEERLVQAFAIINKFKDRMLPPNYDFIVDVPYETDQDKIDSLKLIGRIPKPFHLQLFSLVPYPGTKIYEMAKKDGLIVDEKRRIYGKSFAVREASYLNFLITLCRNGRFPGILIRAMISSVMMHLFNSKPMKPVFKSFYTVLRSTYRMTKKLVS